MKSMGVAVAAIACVLFVAPSARAQNRFKDCAAQWSAMKEAKQTEGKNYRAFQKECLSKSNALSQEAGADDIKTKKPPRKRTAKTKPETSPETSSENAVKKKLSPAQEAASTRRRECGAEWKADKAAGKIAEGMKWPQYFSACNARKKGASA